jgi:hypothetical protein
MKKLLLLALLFAANGYAQQITWQRYYAISNTINICNDIIQLSDSGFMVNARVVIQGDVKNVVFRTNKYGDTLWCKSQEVIGNLVMTFDSSYVIGGGYVMVIGGSPQSIGKLVKMDSNGDSVWTQYYPQFISISVTASNDSGFILNASSSIIKTHSLGAVQWTGYFSGTISKIIPCANGDILVVGMYAGYNDTYKAKLFSATGQVLWERKHGMIPDDWGNILEFGMKDAVELPDGNFLVAAGGYHPHINDSSGWDMIKLDRLTGDTLQTYVYDSISSSVQYLVQMTYTTDSNIVVQMDGALFKIKQDGSLIWFKYAPMAVWDLISCNDNGIAIAGYYATGPSLSYSAYAKLDSLGNIYNFQSVPELAINELRVFPNPASHQLTINHLQLTIGKPVTVTVYDVMGKIHLQQTQTAVSNLKLDLHTLPSGMYVLQVQQADRLFTGRFVKE